MFCFLLLAAVVVYCVNMSSDSKWRLSGVTRIANLLHSTKNVKGKILVVGTHSEAKHPDFNIEDDEVAKKCRFLAVSSVTGEGMNEVMAAIFEEAFTGTPGRELSEAWKKEKLEAEEAEASKKAAAQKKKEDRKAEKEEEFKLLVPFSKKTKTEAGEEEEARDIAPMA